MSDERHVRKMGWFPQAVLVFCVIILWFIALDQRYGSRPLPPGQALGFIAVILAITICVFARAVSK